jgi:chaperone modulatory protein CbpM
MEHYDAIDEPLTIDAIADCANCRRSLVVALIREGLIESIEVREETRVPRRAIFQIRRMQRLRDDLGVNFAGAAVILDLLSRIEALKRELNQR